MKIIAYGIREDERLMSKLAMGQSRCGTGLYGQAAGR